MFKKTFLIGLVLMGSLALAACGGGGSGDSKSHNNGGGGSGQTSQVAFTADPAWGNAQTLDISGTTSSGQAYTKNGVALAAGTTNVDLPYGTYNVTWHHDTSHAGHVNGDEHHQFNVNAPSHHYNHH